MKKTHIIRYFAVALVVLSTASCKKFLTVQPVGQTTIPTLFSDMDGIRAAMPGVYAKTYDYYTNNFYRYPEIAGDLLQLDVNRSGADNVDLYNFDSTPALEAAPAAKIWQEVLEALANVNNALFYLPQLEAKYPQQINELRTYKAELLFLRALTHFDLVRVYAQPYTYSAGAEHLGVPVLRQTPGPDDVVDRKSVKQVYDLIVGDLKDAENLYAQSNYERIASHRPYFVNKEAVWGLLSRVYLYMENWDEVINYSNLVIQNRPLAKGNQYLDQYFNLSGSETEILFRLNGQDKGSNLYNFYNYRSGAANSIPVTQVSTKFLEKFNNQDTDIRKELIANVGLNAVWYATRKFDAEQAPNTENNKMHVNPIVLRVSEMYLNRAEAYIGKQQAALAANDIKTLRARAENVAESAIELPSTDLDAMKQIVYDERIKELAFEGHRLFDITRRKQDLVRSSNTTSAVQTMSYPSDYFVLPIPQRELDANPNMRPNPTVNN